jgi:hypothetical protein
MKRLLILLCFSLIPLAGFSPKNTETIFYIPEGVKIQPYENLWRAICIVESNNNPLAYNAREKAVGIAQIRAIRLKHYNRLTGKHYKLRDMYDPIKAKEVFMYFACQYQERDYETIARRWNGSGKKTTAYWNKIKGHL